MQQEVFFEDLGNRKYKEVWAYQESLLSANSAIKASYRNQTEIPVMEWPTKNHLLFVEHPPVYTLGKNGNAANVLMTTAFMEANGIDYFHTNRGGDITFHGPEQLVGYPILDLEKFKTDLGWYLRSLEEVIILTLAHYGVVAGRSAGETGVWLDPDNKKLARKICAMGIKCSRWITMHGFALNVNTDLAYFNNIVPCGIPDKQVTSLQKELGYAVPMQEVKELVKQNFEQIFGATLVD
jgi:lipoyl(octanoyl) transferase